MKSNNKGTIQVIVRDDVYSRLYDNTIELNDRKAIRQMLDDLESKGVELKKGWFD